jgi:hypothetical protein
MHYKLTHVVRLKMTHPGAPGGIRTHDPRIRNPVLYPAELRALKRAVSDTLTDLKKNSRVSGFGAE